MAMTLTITGENLADVLSQLSRARPAPDTAAGALAQGRGVDGGTAEGDPNAVATTETPQAEQTTKRTRRTKAEIAAAEAAAKEAAQQPEQAPAAADASDAQPGAEQPAEKETTIDDVRGALHALSKAKGADAVFELLKGFDCKNASGVPVERRAECVRKAKEAEAK